MRRVAIVGCPGSGKSTLALQLGERLGLPVVHLDRLHWRPGWQAPPDDEWAETVRDAAAGERWIIDGNYGGTLKPRIDRADTVVMLDLPRRACLWRVAKRWARYRGRQRPEMGDGCPERLDAGFIKWIWDYPRRSRPKTLALLRAKPDGRVFILRSARDIADFLALVAPVLTAHRTAPA
jgi:adenylate kinase family enzyme